MAEANRRLNDYVAAVVNALTEQDGSSLARLVRVSRPGGYSQIVAEGLDTGKDARKLARKAQQWGLEEMLHSHLLCLQAFHQHRYADAYTELQNSATLFLQEFRNWESPWALETLHEMVFDVRSTAEMADAEIAAAGRIPERLKGAGSFLMKVFGALAGKGPKRIGALHVACQLFKIYFKLGTVHLCRSIIRVIDAGRGFEDYPARDQVTYKYYTGRLDVFNDNFTAADEKLGYALRRCHRENRGNLRRILKYLIPVRLSLGRLPTQELLDHFNLPEYVGVVRAMRRGDVRMLRDALQRHEDQFLRAGVYLVLEKLELQVYRRLIKKIHLIQRQRDPERAHQLRMDAIVRALQWLHIPMDTDEVECITATLIYKNLIKGYFSHKSKVVVLSKQDPFPKLT